MSDLDKIRHPEYRERLEQWLRGWDFYRSGQYVTHPQRHIGTRFRLRERTVDGETVYEPEARNHNSYLDANVREGDAEFDSRRERSVHYPFYRSLCGIYAAATLRTAPKREDSQEWRAYEANTDKCGRPIDALVARSLEWALAMDRVFAVTEMPQSPDGEPWASRKHADDAGARPYTYLVKPFDLVDWQPDSEGRFQWVLIREDAPVDRGVGEEYPDKVESLYRYWDDRGWILYDSTKKQLGGGTHPVGRVPVQCLDTEGLLSASIELDRNIFNAVSLLDDQVIKQCFSVMGIPVAPGEEIGQINIGPASAFGYNAESGAPLFISPDVRLIEVQWKLVLDKIHLFREFARMSRGRAEYSKEERSAASLTLESNDKASALAGLAERCENFDEAIHEDAARWWGQDAPKKANYSRELTLKSVGEQINDAVNLTRLAPSNRLRTILARGPVSRHLREQGIGQDVVSEAIGSLEEIEPATAKDAA